MSCFNKIAGAHKMIVYISYPCPLLSDAVNKRVRLSICYFLAHFISSLHGVLWCQLSFLFSHRTLWDFITLVITFLWACRCTIKVYAVYMRDVVVIVFLFVCFVLFSFIIVSMFITEAHWPVEWNWPARSCQCRLARVSQAYVSRESKDNQGLFTNILYAVIRLRSL